ncbi:MAG: beta-N-acetylhexosaminidase, partial [Kosmotogaceae bacterium]|nr:beta-N-acetylhexosaminidase [Kosmotogaceae bacterium]
MNLDEAVGRLFLIGIPGPEIDSETEKTLREVKPGAVILFSKNIVDSAQIRDLVDEIERVLRYKPAIAIDQEGGIVSRLRDGFSVSPGAMAIAATGSTENSYVVGRIMAREMNAIGVNWNLAPVVDINCNPKNPGIGVRSFGDSPDLVIAYARAFMQGMRSGGVMGCLKHFPGKGRVDVDAHLDLPILDISRSMLYEYELRPFKEIQADSIMPSHIYLPQIQASRVPASMSREILTDLARNVLNYRGVLVADDLGMGGVSNYFTPEEAAVEGLINGMDYLTYCHDPVIQRRVKKILIREIEKSPELEKRFQESLERVEKFRIEATSAERFSIEEIASRESLKAMQEISDKSITAILDDKSLIPLPLSSVSAIYSVRLSRLVQVEDGPQKGVPAVAREIAQMVDCPVIDYAAGMTVEEADMLALSATGKGIRLVFTENAHLHEGQRELLLKLSQRTGRTLVIALRNPYDAFLKGVKNCIISYGYEAVSQRSIKKVLDGNIKAQGKLPV